MKCYIIIVLLLAVFVIVYCNKAINYGKPPEKNDQLSVREMIKSWKSQKDSRWKQKLTRAERKQFHRMAKAVRISLRENKKKRRRERRKQRRAERKARRMARKNARRARGRSSQNKLKSRGIARNNGRNPRWKAQKNNRRSRLMPQKNKRRSRSTSRRNTRKYRANRRQKRQAEPEQSNKTEPEEQYLCERQEWRQMTVEERRAFRKSLQQIENNGGRTELISYHQNDQSPGAHDGPLFCLWHRFYLTLMEQLLMLNDKESCLPYWDPCLEHRLGYYTGGDFHTSALFHPHPDYGVGESRGELTTGAFANLTSYPGCPSVHRDVPTNGSWNLMTYLDVSKEYTSYTTHEELSSPMNPRFETDHGSCHMMIGGSMGQLSCAPTDMMFWFLHNYVDCMWEVNRQHRTNRQDNYPSDSTLLRYGKTFEENNKLEAEVKPFSSPEAPLTGHDLLSDNFTQSFYTCAEHPCIISCYANEDCDSDMLWCDVPLESCVPKILPGHPPLKNYGTDTVRLESVFCLPGTHPEVKSDGNAECVAD